MTKNNIFFDDYYFQGEQAEMAKRLSEEFTVDKESGTKIFETTVDLYAASAVVGCFFDKKASVTKGDMKRAILQNAFQHRIETLNFIYKLVILYANRFNTNEQIIDKVFRNPDSDENHNLFNSFVLGGLEEIYKNICLKTNVRYIDYLKSVTEFLKHFDNDPESEETKKMVQKIITN